MCHHWVMSPLQRQPSLGPTYSRTDGSCLWWGGRTESELLPHSTSNLTFQRSHFICHPQSPLPPDASLLFWGSDMPCCSPTSTKQAACHTGFSSSCTPLLWRPFTSYFQTFFLFFLVRPPHFLFCLCLPNRSLSFLFPGDEWPLAVLLTARQLMPHNYCITI